MGRIGRMGRMIYGTRGQGDYHWDYGTMGRHPLACGAALRTTHHALRLAPSAHTCAASAGQMPLRFDAGRVHTIASGPLAPPFKSHHGSVAAHTCAASAGQMPLRFDAGRVHTIASGPLAPPFKPAPCTLHPAPFTNAIPRPGVDSRRWRVFRSAGCRDCLREYYPGRIE